MMPRPKSFALFVLTSLFVSYSGPAENPVTIRLVDSFQAALETRLPVAESPEGMSQEDLQRLKSLGYSQ